MQCAEAGDDNETREKRGTDEQASEGVEPEWALDEAAATQVENKEDEQVRNPRAETKQRDSTEDKAEGLEPNGYRE